MSNQSNKILVVYNTCGLRNKNNDAYYIKAINSILNQNFIDYKLVISSCLNSNDTINNLKNEFQDRIFINRIHDILPLNTTFNFSVKKSIEHLGEFDSYLYLDSGVALDDSEILNKFYELYSTKLYSIISAYTDTDMTVFHQAPKIDNHYVIPVGEAVNLHCQLFSHQFYETYDGLMPSIFMGYCSESVLSFMASAINTRWAIHKDIHVHHQQDLDGQSHAANIPIWEGSGKKTWKHPFMITEEDFMERLCGQKAKELGLGYEEGQQICLHNPDCYDENGFAKNIELKSYIRDNLFLKNIFNYNNINHESI